MTPMMQVARNVAIGLALLSLFVATIAVMILFVAHP